MLHLLQPIWLLASAGILIPLAIHLWNIRQGKTLKIGSIELLARTAQQHARSLRLTELFLLLLRCLLILLLALLLAKPYWQNTTKQKGWIVMEQKNAQLAYAKFQPLVDSLSKEGYSFHLFEKGFAETDLTKIATEKKDTTAGTASYWQLVKMLDEQLPAGVPVYLFTENGLNHFKGTRPEAARTITWKTFSPSDSVHVFIADAYETPNDSIAVKIGASNSSGTNYHLELLAKNKPKQNDFSLSVAEGKMLVNYQNDQPVVVDTAALHITIFAEGYADDARYLQAAIQSIQDVFRRKIITQKIYKKQALPASQDWIFWLSAQALPGKINAAHMLMYAAGKTNEVTSWIQENNSSTQDKIKLYQRIAYDAKNTNVLWRDGFGTPLLDKKVNAENEIYYCYTHFNPSWNDLVWDASFPTLIFQLINTSTGKIMEKDDRRIIADAQLQIPVTAISKKTTFNNTVDTTATTRVLWVIAFLLFSVERYFSFRIKKEKVNA